MSEKSSDELAVIAVIEQYIKSYTEADILALRDLFASDAVMNGYVDGKLIVGSPEPFFQNVASKPSLKSSKLSLDFKIEYVSVTNHAASVVVREFEFGPFSFTDYMHLLKMNGVWKIVSKTFTTF